MTPQELLTAYQQASGLPVSLSPTRMHSLTSLVLIGVTPEDVKRVVGELKRLMKRKPDIYTESCLEFRNCMADPDKFEERMLTLRQREARKAPHKPQVARETSTGFTVLDSPIAPDPAILDVRGSLMSIANNLPKSA